MNRWLHWFNLLGVFALAALCVVQWRVNRQLNLQVNRREQFRLEQAAKLEEQAKTTAGQAGDLASLRTHLARLSDELRDTAAKLAAAERQLRQSEAERDQLKSSVTNWAAAVAARDERLKQAAGQFQALTEKRDEAVMKFNQLAERHNKLVKDWNELQARLTEKARADSNEPPPLR